MARAMMPAEFEDRPISRCVAATTKTVREADGRKHVYRQLPDGSWLDIRPAPEWDGTPFDELELPNASGNDDFEQIAESVRMAGFRSVREFLVAYRAHAERLTRLVYPGDAHLMTVQQKRIAEFVEHLDRRRDEWERWRATNLDTAD